MGARIGCIDVGLGVPVNVSATVVAVTLTPFCWRVAAKAAAKVVFDALV